MGNVVHENIITFEKEAIQFIDTVGSVSVKKGMALVKDLDFVTTNTGETATDTFNQRLYIAKKPTVTDQKFLGVAAQKIPAVSGGQRKWCYANLPINDLSGAEILTLSGCSLGDSLSYIATGTNAGYWYVTGETGKGTAVAMKTVTSGLCPAALNVGGDGVGGLDPVTLGAAGGAVTISQFGTTYVTGTAISANATFTLADGIFEGQRKVIKVVNTAITTNSLVVTVTNGLQKDGTTALATLTFNALGEYADLVWKGGVWNVTAINGATQA